MLYSDVQFSSKLILVSRRIIKGRLGKLENAIETESLYTEAPAD